MTVLTLPSLDQTSQIDWSLQSNTQTFTSPISKTTQRRELTGARWQCVVTLKNQSDDNQREWMVALAKLRGASGSCYLSPSVFYPFKGTGGGTPLVKGASQTGTSLLIDGCTTGVTNWIKAGDYFSFDSGTGRELKICTANANSSGAGEVTISFEPPIHTSPADNAAVEISAPSAIMRLVDDNQFKMTVTPPYRGAATIQFIETFPS